MFISHRGYEGNYKQTVVKNLLVVDILVVCYAVRLLIMKDDGSTPFILLLNI